jgi:hypothetical protein
MSEEFKVLRSIFFLGLFCFLFFSGAIFLGSVCERNKNTDAIESHKNYTIFCENGLQYKIKNNIAFPVLNTDGTQAKCDTIH